MNLSQEAIKYILLSLGIVIVCYSIFLLYKEAMNSRSEISKLKDKVNTLSETVDNLAINEENDGDNEEDGDDFSFNPLNLNKIVEDSYHLSNLRELQEHNKSSIEELPIPEEPEEPKEPKEPKEPEEPKKTEEPEEPGLSFTPVQKKTPKKSKKLTKVKESVKQEQE